MIRYWNQWGKERKTSGSNINFFCMVTIGVWRKTKYYENREKILHFVTPFFFFVHNIWGKLGKVCRNIWHRFAFYFLPRCISFFLSLCLSSCGTEKVSFLVCQSSQINTTFFKTTSVTLEASTIILDAEYINSSLQLMWCNLCHLLASMQST